MSNAMGERVNKPSGAVVAGAVRLLLSALALLAVAGCASVNVQHPQVLDNDAGAEQRAQAARVYFVRPRPYKGKGVADGPVRITYKDKPLLKMAEGSYALLYIKPGKGQLKVFNETEFTNTGEVIEVWRGRRYRFIAGRTYFIYVRRIDEEFRGIFYELDPVTLERARRLIDTARPSGGAARSEPIDELTDVVPPPASAVQGVRPALPEDVYRQVR